MSSGRTRPGTVLLGGKCLTPGVEGTRCGVQDGTLLGVCNQGTWCDMGGLSHGTCKHVNAEGETCDDYSGPRCAWSLFCRDGRCQKPQAEGGACKAPGTCQPVGARSCD